MAVADAVALVDEVEMRVDMQDVDRPLAGEGLDAGDVDRVVAADHHRERAGVEDGSDAGRDVRVASRGVGMDDVGVADVDDPHRLGQVDGVVLVVVGAGVAEGEERRGLAHRARAEAGAGAELRAEVEGGAEHGDVGVDGGPVLDVGALAEGRDADEGQVQPAGVVGVITHLVLSFGTAEGVLPATMPQSPSRKNRDVSMLTLANANVSVRERGRRSPCRIERSRGSRQPGSGPSADMPPGSDH